ncbi:MAG: hypothetical protein PHN93_04075 [Sphaerochaetaceae bacterium]|jgi:hypothetical protein|nr:hypothetical protein [Sphaerochaetaceae bacterium]MDX9939120.1 hypothetical protein [Sphaerochaetaceae bacterium]
MDVKRLQLWEGRHATMVSNDSLRSVIEDRGGMVLELSNTNSQGGRVNAHPLYWFRGRGYSVASDDNHEFWKESSLLYNLGGNFLCFPNFGPDHKVGEVYHEAHGWTANGLWNVVKYGTDAETGANWLLSTMTGPDSAYPFEAWKIDMMLPGHPVLYTSVSIKNTGTVALPANAAWHNTVGSPFLESGCVINLCADAFSTAPGNSEFDRTGRLAMGKDFSDLTKVPLRKEGTCDLTEVPPMIGYTDFITGRVPSDARLGYSSVINPRLKMLYFSFFTGPAAAEQNEIVLRFNNLWMQYGGRPFTPWALYDGGADQTFCLGVENAIGHFANGLGSAIENPLCLGAPTTVSLAPGETKVQRYGTAFASYDNAKISAGIQSVEQVVEGLVLKRGKAWAFIEADSTFHFLKQMEGKLLSL